MAVSTKSLDYEQAGQTYEGFLAMPEGKPKAVVLVSHAWGGQNEFDHDKAKMLAEWGYAGFALDVYGKGKRGSTKEESQALMEPLLPQLSRPASQLHRHHLLGLVESAVR